MYQEVTKTLDTKKSYLSRAILLQKKALKDYSIIFGKPPATELMIAKIKNKPTETLNITNTAIFACQFWAPTLARSTWRYYRSSLIYYAEILHRNSALPYPELMKITTILRNTSGSSFKYNRTSSQKKKHIQDTDLNILTMALENSRSKYAEVLKEWLYANCLVGLRPCEWKNTQIVEKENKKALLVYNAKTTNGRSHGKIRIIYINHFPSQTISFLSFFSKKMNEITKNNRYEKTYNGCRILLQKLNKKLWTCRKKNITLYSSRHQFSADLKKAGASLEEIAYLMGHYSTDTASNHYGKRRYGKSIVKPYINKQLTIGIKDKFKPFTLRSKPKNPKNIPN